MLILWAMSASAKGGRFRAIAKGSSTDVGSRLIAVIAVISGLTYKRGEKDNAALY